ncbi:Saccharopine dehydrogenase, partial [Cladochytrium tenue]
FVVDAYNQLKRQNYKFPVEKKPDVIKRQSDIQKEKEEEELQIAGSKRTRNVTIAAPVTSQPKVICRVRALYDFAGMDEGELRLQRGDIVDVYDDTTFKDWWKGEIHGKVGIFPSNYVEKLSDVESSAPLGSTEPASDPALSDASRVDEFISVLTRIDPRKENFSENGHVQELYHSLLQMRPRLSTTTMHLWLRAETKPSEHRTALTPAHVRALVQEGAKITVERSSQSIFDVVEFEQAGAELVPEGSWRNAPSDAYILGLKELPENDDSPLPHTHIMFAHCFKSQDGWADVLSRFDRGNGTLLDLEFLADDKGRRVAAFGYHAGYAGAAVGIDIWCHRQLRTSPDEPYPSITHYANADDLIAYTKKRLAAAWGKAGGRLPSIMVMGALGRCGSGACDFARHVGLPEASIVRWDLAETRVGGPFPEILRHDIFVNSIYLSAKIPPFLTAEMLRGGVDGGRALQVIVDVSCDATNPNNPLPFYSACTTFTNPTLTLDCAPLPSVDVVAIDHLPTLLPRESSEAFVHDLLPTLRDLDRRANSPVWARAEKLFRDKVAEARASRA